MAYASVKGLVRTYVMHQQLLEHLPEPPATVLDVGGGAGHQSFPLAQAGYDVTVLDPSPAMLAKAGQRLQGLPAEAQRRVTLLQADGETADAAVGGRRFAAVLCHGVLGYLEQPEPLVDQLCRCAAPGGVVSIMTGNAKASAVRPALERRWDDALASFDARTEIGVLGVPGRADTVEELSELIRSRGVEPVLVRGLAVRRPARVQRSRAGPQRCEAGRGDRRSRARGQQTRPLPPAQSGLSSRRAQESELTGRPQAGVCPQAAPGRELSPDPPVADHRSAAPVDARCAGTRPAGRGGRR
jgi:S-adenosylmethionine-dependent methyltransferase